ncbi:MAG: septum formation protein Maf [Elusimicrobia bacterium]|nr:septum formation protein Maf [Elusimicrobiota bacterium]
MPALILASASPQRRRLLKKLGRRFRVIPSRVSEKSAQRDPRRVALELALRKARAVSRRHPRALVLGADTIVVCRGKIIGKPKSLSHARRILKELNGRWHRVYTGVALSLPGPGGVRASVAITRVKARRLDEAKLSTLAGKHMDKAGAYAVQDRRDPFIAQIRGDMDNVIGLPVSLVRRLLSRAGYPGPDRAAPREARSRSKLL